MNLTCKQCGHRIPAADMNLEQMVAKCAQCDAVFSFDREIHEPRPQGRAPVDLPEGWTLHAEDASPFERLDYRRAASTVRAKFSLSWRWFSPRHIGLLLFALFWCGFLANWYVGVTAAGAPLLFFVFPMLHVGAGVYMLYSSLAGLLNRTTLSVDGDVLAIEHHPLPWRGARKLPVHEIKQVYCVEVRTRARNGSEVRFAVRAQRHQGAEVELVKHLEQSNQALFIERKLEEALGIDDIPVTGELSK